MQVISLKNTTKETTKGEAAPSTSQTSLRLIGLMVGITLLTGLAVLLPLGGQEVAALVLLVGLSVICLRSAALALPLALAYLPLGVRLNLGNGNLSLLLSFWLFDLICLKNLVWLWRNRQWHWFKPRPGVSMFLLLFVAALGLSTLLSINFGLSVRKLYDLAQYLAIYLALVSSKRRYNRLSLHLLLEALLLSGACTALLGTLEFYSQFGWGSPYLARDYYLQHTAALFEGTRSFNLLKDGLDNWVLINGPLRAFGSLLTPAGLGQYLLMGVVVLAVYVPLRQFRFVSRFSTTPRLNWWLVWVAAELLFLAIFFTYARASWFVALAILAAVGVIWLRRRHSLRWPEPRKLVLGLVALLLPLSLNLVGFSLYHYHFTTPLADSPSSLPPANVSAQPVGLVALAQPWAAGLFQVAPPISNTVAPTPPVALEVNPNFVQNQQQPLVRLLQIFNLQDHSTQDRLEAWKYGFRVWSSHPIFGRGPGTFGLGGLANNLYVKEAVTPTVEQASVQAHNMYLNFLVENGVVGLALYLWLIGYTLYRLLNLRPQTIAGLATKLILIVWLVAFSWDEFFDNLFLYTKNGSLLFVALGLAAILIGHQPASAATPQPPKLFVSPQSAEI